MKISVAFFLLILFTQCQRDKPYANQDLSLWQEVEEKTIQKIAQARPHWATAAGMKGYDSSLFIPGLGQRNFDADWSYRLLDDLRGWDTSMLSPAQKKNKQHIENLAQNILWDIEVLQTHHQDPVAWVFPEAIILCLQQKNITKRNKILHAEILLELAVMYYEKTMLDLIHMDSTRNDMAVEADLYALRLLQGMVKDSVNNAELTGVERGRVLQKIRTAEQEVITHLAFLGSPPPLSSHSNGDSFTHPFPQKWIPEIEKTSREIFLRLIEK